MYKCFHVLDLDTLQTYFFDILTFWIICVYLERNELCLERNMNGQRVCTFDQLFPFKFRILNINLEVLFLLLSSYGLSCNFFEDLYIS